MRACTHDSICSPTHALERASVGGALAAGQEVPTRPGGLRQRAAAPVHGAVLACTGARMPESGEAVPNVRRSGIRLHAGTDRRDWDD